MATNLLKKIEVGNPLVNLGLNGLFEEYENVQSDEQMAKFYHRFLTLCEGSEVSTRVAYAMIAHASDNDIESQISLLIEENINQ